MSDLSVATDAALEAERAYTGSLVESLTSQHAGDAQTISELQAAYATLEQQFDDYRQTHPDENPEPPTQTVLAGCSASDWNHGPMTAARNVARIFSFGQVDAEIAMSPKLETGVLLLSDDRAALTPAQLETRLRALLQAHPGVRVVWFPENEVTARSSISASDARNIVAKSAAHRVVTDKFDRVVNSIDLTSYGVKVGKHVPLTAAGIADTIEVLASSCYNPGRDSRPPVWDDYGYLDVVLDVAVDWGVPEFWVGEWGNPVDPRDPSKRPQWNADFVAYVFAGCNARGVRLGGVSYWDQWKSGAPNDNRLQADNPRTAQAILDAVASLS